MTRTGSCMCGAVRFEASVTPDTFGACHCGMCRKWSGGVYLGIEVKPDTMKIDGADALTHYASSAWAERSFCGKCGSCLWYRVTAPGPHQGVYHIGVGSLDDLSGLQMTEEIFIDKKPAAYAFAGPTKTMTEAEVMAMFSAPPS